MASNETPSRAQARWPSRDLSASLLVLAATFAAWSSSGARAGDDSEFFEKKVRPILVDRCDRCHNAAGKRGGGLALDTRAGWEKGGDSGPAILPGDPDGSPLVQAVRWGDEALRMPPDKAGGKLPAEQIADLESWVKRGAFDPRAGRETGPSRPSWAEAFEGRRSWWSLRPVAPPPVPDVEGGEWSGSAVDRFLRRRMDAEGVSPSEVASPRTLLRRASLVLTGLPPTPEEAAAFEEAARRDHAGAYEALVDRLLASPRFGERFARHWLDVVRFSETHGNEWNYDVPYAWRYRDYVIRAFNDDLPYDQFVREHIAGDLLPQPRWNEEGRFNESAIGTASYRFGEVNHDSCVEFGVIGYDIADNQLDTLTKAFQATTVACARCHDHKMDAVSTRDYHALLGILRSSRSVMHTLDGPEVNREAIAELKRTKADIRAAIGPVWHAEAGAIDAGKLATRLGLPGEDLAPVDSPSRAWAAVTRARAKGEDVVEAWGRLVAEQAAEVASRPEFDRTHFRVVADFRKGIEPGWTATGMGLREGAGRSGDFAVAIEGESAIKTLLPSGLFTFAVSDKLNGALRSPTLERLHGKLCFEVIGGGSSLERLVFNNCQINYNNQHGLHHDDWTWVTVNFPEKTAELHPYAELLTFWDSPKFPDPLGTLGQGAENQRQPWAFHAKDPRTWWGVRRIVAQDGAETPKGDIAHLSRLLAGPPPAGSEELAARYARIAAEAANAFAEDRASDEDVQWLRWLLKCGLISNRADASPRLAELIARYRQVEGRDLALPRTMPGLADEGAPFDQPVLVRGDHTRPGELVGRRYLEAIDPDGARVPRPLRGSGRAAVAERVADPGNPLTARVMANRVWQWAFGRGLVRTPDDFGHMGEAPSHPDLLDFLAERFVAEGWSVKRLVRELVLSRAFRGAAAPTGSAREKDPENRLLSHYPARRAEAEVIRDGLLAVSGRLDGRLYGPSVHPHRDKDDPEKRLYAGPLDGEGRRSLYIKFQLMEPPQFLGAFNLPGGKVAQGRRDSSNVPAQSLALLNDPFVWAMADGWAGRVLGDGCAAEAVRIDRMFQTAFGRPASAAEVDRFTTAVRAFAEMHGVAAGDLMGSRPVWKDAAHAIFNFKEFIFIP